MDFVTRLPRTPKNYDAIWEVVERMTKTIHLIPVRMDFKLGILSRLYISRIVCLYVVPTSIVSNRDPRFTLKFWKPLQKA